MTISLSTHLSSPLIRIIADFLACDSESVEDLNGLSSVVNNQNDRSYISKKIVTVSSISFSQLAQSKKRKKRIDDNIPFQRQLQKEIQVNDPNFRLKTFSKLLSSPITITSQNFFEKDFLQTTLLMRLIEKGFVTTIAKFLPQLTKEQQKKLVDEKDLHGNTALIRAVSLKRENSYPCIQILVEMRADLDIQNQEGETAYTIAKKVGDAKVLSMLC